MPDWLEVSLRTLSSIVILFAITKLLGKRQLSELSLFEYITGITIGDLAATTSIGLESKWYIGIVALGVWTSVAMGIEYIQLKSKGFRNWIDGKATVLIKNGKILEDNFKKERITIDEFMSQLRKKNTFEVSDVEFAVMEPSGAISFLLTSENQPITPKMLGVQLPEKLEPQLVISDGSIMDESLTRLGLHRRWLKTELEKQGVTLENVFLGQVDAEGQLHLDLYDDQIDIQPPQEKASLLAMLKKCEADIEIFSLSTQDLDAKKMYEQGSQELQQMITKLKPYLMNEGIIDGQSAKEKSYTDTTGVSEASKTE